jgi:hypothetical protein
MRQSESKDLRLFFPRSDGTALFRAERVGPLATRDRRRLEGTIGRFQQDSVNIVTPALAEPRICELNGLNIPFQLKARKAQNRGPSRTG